MESRLQALEVTYRPELLFNAEGHILKRFRPPHACSASHVFAHTHPICPKACGNCACQKDPQLHPEAFENLWPPILF